MVKFGLIGCGAAARYHADVIRGLGHRVTAVAARPDSPHLERFARDYEVTRAFTDWREMVSHAPVDALIVAASWDQIERLAAEVIETGLPVLLEKPLALSREHAEAILSAACGHEPHVMVGYNRRFYDFIPHLKDLIDRSRLLAVELNCPDALRANLAREGERLRDHILFYKTSHWLDLAQYLSGPLEIVEMFCRSDGVLAYNGLLQTREGVPVHLLANFDAPAHICLTFTFEGFLCQLSPAEVFRRYEGMASVEPTGQGASRRYEPHLKEECVTDTTYKPGLVNQLRHFIEGCVEGRSVEFRGCTLQEAVRVTRLCEQMTRESVVTSAASSRA